ncbi:hypothetical protein AAFH68_30290 [Flavobacterium sp. CGRL1]
MNLYNDESLIQQLPGFKNNYTTVNGVNLHYATGGQGSPLVLIPGWPQTWWSYRKIMPILAEKHSLIVVDLRGMGSSEKPLDGYTKKKYGPGYSIVNCTFGIQKNKYCRS